jgi:hypothetical protein
MALVRVGRLAAIDLDRVRAIRLEGEAASVHFGDAGCSITFSNAAGEWSSLVDSLPPVGTLYPNDSQGLSEGGEAGLPKPGAAGIG